MKHFLFLACLRPFQLNAVCISHLLLKKTSLLESTSELYRPRNRCLSTKLMSTFADRGCHVVSVTDPYDSILGFVDRIILSYARLNTMNIFLLACPKIVSKVQIIELAITKSSAVACFLLHFRSKCSLQHLVL
jgi:hypothetical protein